MHGYQPTRVPTARGARQGYRGTSDTGKKEYKQVLTEWCPGRKGREHHIETQEELLQQRIQRGVRAITDPDTVAAEEIQCMS